MSMFGNREKDNLYEEMTMFLENYQPYELIDIVRAVFEYNFELSKEE